MAEVHISTIEESREYWNNFTDSYVATLEPLTYLIDVEIQYMAQLATAKKGVVVPGAGPGLGALNVRQKVNSDVKVYVGDISDKMIEASQALFKKNDIDLDSPSSTTVVKMMDNQDMPIESASCDRYISNLSWMLVPDPKLQAQEAHRVLDDGGIALFSVWGRPEFSAFHMLPLGLMKEVGIKTPPKRSNFHLNEGTIATDLLKEAGFKKVISWYHTVPCGIFSGRQYVAALEGVQSWQKLFVGLGDKADDFKTTLRERADAILDSGKPLTFDSLVLLAIK